MPINENDTSWTTSTNIQAMPIVHYTYSVVHNYSEDYVQVLSQKAFIFPKTNG